jgi:hypothetical protein
LPYLRPSDVLCRSLYFCPLPRIQLEMHPTFELSNCELQHLADIRSTDRCLARVKVLNCLWPFVVHFRCAVSASVTRPSHRSVPLPCASCSIRMEFDRTSTGFHRGIGAFEAAWTWPWLAPQIREAMAVLAVETPVSATVASPNSPKPTDPLTVSATRNQEQLTD